MDKGKLIAVVTGASRGAGQGIAIALGRHGCTVYVTGRSDGSGEAAGAGTIQETAAAVTAAGGLGIAVRVDHANDQEVEALFAQVMAEQGRLDILVNNAAAVHDELTDPGTFWQKPIKLAQIIDVGLRSAYIASYFAAPIMVGQGSGLIVNTSSSGSVHYAFGPAYGAQKAGLDKMAFDMALDFAETGVVAVSIWMGALLSDRLKHLIATEPEKYGMMREVAETTEFTGHVIWGLYHDPNLANHNGETLIGAELAIEYGIKDAGDRSPPSHRHVMAVEPQRRFPAILR